MSRLTRYEVDTEYDSDGDAFGSMSPCADGEYVRFEDVQKLLSALLTDGFDAEWRERLRVATAESHEKDLVIRKLHAQIFSLLSRASGFTTPTDEVTP